MLPLSFKMRVWDLSSGLPDVKTAQHKLFRSEWRVKKKKKKEIKEKLKLTIISFLSKKTQMEASLVQFVLGVNIR